jgi:hypothetical protein
MPSFGRAVSGQIRADRARAGYAAGVPRSWAAGERIAGLATARIFGASERFGLRAASAAESGERGAGNGHRSEPAQDIAAQHRRGQQDGSFDVHRKSFSV